MPGDFVENRLAQIFELIGAGICWMLCSRLNNVLQSLETGSCVFEVQAQLTKDPDDRDYFHRKQQLTLSGGEEIRRAKRPRESPEKRPTYSSAIDLEPIPKSPTVDQNWANIDVETCMAIMGSHTFLWGHHDARASLHHLNCNAETKLP